MEEKQTLNFRLGSDVGRLVAAAVREKITEECDPDAAMRSLSEAFPGMPDELCLDVISGRQYLHLSDDGAGMELDPWTPDLEDEYPPFRMDEWAEEKLLGMKLSAAEWMKAVDLVRSEMGRARNRGEFEIRYDTLAKYFATGDVRDVLEDIVTGDDLAESMKSLYEYANEFLARSGRIIRTIRWLYDKYGSDEIPDGFLVEPRELGMLAVKLNNLASCRAEIASEEEDMLRLRKEVDMMSMRDGAFKEQFADIKPADITGEYSAGWLGPDGAFYGANGSYCDMIHAELADALASAGAVPGMDGVPDAWLGEHGWIKIHGNRILFEGYMQAEYGLPRVELTDRQVDELYRYGQACCGGMLRLGTSGRPVSAARLRATEPLMRAGYFD